MTAYTPHAPDSWNSLSPFQRTVWGEFLQTWRRDCAHERSKTGNILTFSDLMKLEMANVPFDVEGKRPYSAFEEAFILEKAGIWRTKAIADEIKRTPTAVLKKIAEMREAGLIKGYRWAR